MDEKRKQDLIKRIDIAEVMKSKGKGRSAKAYVVPAYVTRTIGKDVFDWLGITPDEPDMEWLFYEDEKSGERIAILVKK